MGHCPRAGWYHLSAILYVDDIDLLHIDLTKDETVDEVHAAIKTASTAGEICSLLREVRFNQTNAVIQSYHLNG
jgi:hypothetical protein